MGRPEKGARCSHHGGAVDQEAQTWLERGEGGPGMRGQGLGRHICTQVDPRKYGSSVGFLSPSHWAGPVPHAGKDLGELALCGQVTHIWEPGKAPQDLTFPRRRREWGIPD